MSFINEVFYKKETLFCPETFISLFRAFFLKKFKNISKTFHFFFKTIMRTIQYVFLCFSIACGMLYDII